MLSTALVEIFVTGAAAILAVVLSGLAQMLFAGRASKVRLKLSSGRVVVLDLDRRLARETRSRLVIDAATLAEAGDEVGLKKVLEESHAASVSVRGP